MSVLLNRGAGFNANTPLTHSQETLPPFIFSVFQAVHQKPSTVFAELSSRIFAELGKQTLMQARLVCREWKPLVQGILCHKLKAKFAFSLEEKRLIYILNEKLMNEDDVKQQVSNCLEDHLEGEKDLKENQQFYLKVVKLSRYYGQVKIAATNALMILKKTRFPFAGLKLKGVQVPGVRLARTLLDEVNLAGADLRGADLTDCSLANAVLDGANLKDVEFGRLPYLQHQTEVIAMALSPSGRCLASLDIESLYVWNLETFQVQTQLYEVLPKEGELDSLLKILLMERDGCFLVFSIEEEYLFIAGGRERDIEIWKIKPLQKVGGTPIQGCRTFSLFTLTKDGAHLISVVSMRGENVREKICLWQITQNPEGGPLLKLIHEIIVQNVGQMAFSLETSILAIEIQEKNHEGIEFYSVPELEIKRKWTLPLKEKLGSIDVKGMVFSPQGSQLLITPGDTSRKIIAWDIRNKQRMDLFEEEGKITNLRFLPNSLPHLSLIAYHLFEQGMLCIRDGKNPQKLRARKQVSLRKFFANKKYLFSYKKRKIFISSLDSILGKQGTDYEGQAGYQPKVTQETPISNSITTLCFSPNESLIYFLNASNILYIYNSLSGKNRGNSHLDEQRIRQHIKKSINVPSSLLNKSFRYFIKNKLHYTSLLLLERALLYLSSSFLQASHEECSTLLTQHDKVWGRLIDSIDVVLSTDKRYIVWACQNQLELHEIVSNEDFDRIISAEKSELASIPSFYNDGTRIVLSSKVFPTAILVTIGHRTKLTNLWKVTWKKQKVKLMAQFLSINRVRFNDKAQLFFSSPTQNTIFLWNSLLHKEEPLISFQDRLECFDLSQDSSLMVSIESLSKAEEPLSQRPSSRPKTRLSLWDIIHRQILDSKILPYKLSKVCVSPSGKFVLGWEKKVLKVFEGRDIMDPRVRMKKLCVWGIREGKLHLLWKIPKQLEAHGISLHDIKNLEDKNALLFSQLQKK